MSNCPLADRTWVYFFSMTASPEGTMPRMAVQVIFTVKSWALPGPKFLTLMAAVLPPTVSPSLMGLFRLMLSTDRSDFSTGTAPPEAVGT